MKTLKETLVVTMAAAAWCLFQLYGRESQARAAWQQARDYVAGGSK